MKSPPSPEEARRQALRHMGVFTLLVLAGPVVWGSILVPRRLPEWRGILESQAWPSVTGRTLEATVHAHTGGRRTSTRYSVEVAYEYTVDGRAFTGRRYARDESNGRLDREEAEQLAARLAPGTSVDVIYDPRDPGQAVLTPGALSLAVFWTLAGVASYAAAALALWSIARATFRLVHTPPARPAAPLTAGQELHDLAVAALADGALSPPEEEHLLERARALGLGEPDAVRAALAAVRAHTGAVVFHKPPTPEARLELYRRVADLMHADGKITPRERRLLDAIAERLEVPLDQRVA